MSFSDTVFGKINKNFNHQRKVKEFSNHLELLVDAAYDQGVRDCAANLKKVDLVKVESQEGIEWHLRFGDDMLLDIPDNVILELAKQVKKTKKRTAA